MAAPLKEIIYLSYNGKITMVKNPELVHLTALAPRLKTFNNQNHYMIGVDPDILYSVVGAGEKLASAHLDNRPGSFLNMTQLTASDINYAVIYNIPISTNTYGPPGIPLVVHDEENHLYKDIIRQLIVSVDPDTFEPVVIGKLDADNDIVTLDRNDVEYVHHLQIPLAPGALDLEEEFEHAKILNYITTFLENTERNIFTIKPGRNLRRDPTVPALNTISFTDTSRASVERIRDLLLNVRKINGIPVFRDIMDLYHFGPQVFALLLKSLNLERLTDTIDVIYNLLWYLHIGEAAENLFLNPDATVYISGLSSAKLLELLGTKYYGEMDRASLMYAVLTGDRIEKFGKPRAITEQQEKELYPGIRQTLPSNVWRMAFSGCDHSILEDNNVSIIPPHRFVIKYGFDGPQHNIVRNILQLTTPTTITPLMEKYGAVEVGEVQEDMNDRTVYGQNASFFISVLTRYAKYRIFTRNPNIKPPLLVDPGEPLNVQREKARLLDLLGPLTMVEMRKAYGYQMTTDQMIDIFMPPSKWRFDHVKCNNDDTMNNILLEKHGEVNKNDKEDYTLSYGMLGNYRCYQASELTAFWKEDDDGMFHFYVPDWVVTDKSTGTTTPLDVTTGKLLQREFPLDSIKQLLVLLRENDSQYPTHELIRIISDGIASMESSGNVLRDHVRRYNALPEEQKLLVQEYLVWMFFYSMWMRHWKGPGNPYPTRDIVQGNRTGVCDPFQRDEHTIIQQSVYSRIIEKIEKYPTLKGWIDSLPLISYDFRDGSVKVAVNRTVKSIIDLIQMGDFCLAHASDLLLLASSGLISRFLRIADYRQMNDILRRFLPLLSQIELSVVQAKLQSKNLEKIARDVLRERLARLTNPVQLRQPDFDPARSVFDSNHRDVQHGRNLRFE